MNMKFFFIFVVAFCLYYSFKKTTLNLRMDLNTLDYGTPQENTDQGKIRKKLLEGGNKKIEETKLKV